MQIAMGLAAYCLLNLPYVRAVFGRQYLDPKRNQLFVCNHVSLLDTILLGGEAWRAGTYPILVLGDKKVWQATWFHRFLSRPIGFLVERGKLNPGRIRELEEFGRAARDYQLVVFPEGTRGSGLEVGECQPGIYYIAQAAQVPIVPVFIENMQCVSTKCGKFHPFSGLKKVVIRYGPPIPPSDYLGLSRDEFTGFVRRQISALQPAPQVAARLNPAPLRG